MEGMRHLDPAEMARPDLVPLIARRLAQFHAVALGEDEDGEPQVFAIINKWCANCDAGCEMSVGKPTSHSSDRRGLEQTSRDSAVHTVTC